MPSSLVRFRSPAYTRQHGCCFYCGLQMWSGNPADFIARYGLTAKQAKWLECTAEHLHARQDGGADKPANIVAACRHCNQRRHQRKAALAPEAYRRLVKKRLSEGRWFPSSLVERFAIFRLDADLRQASARAIRSRSAKPR